MNYEYVILGGLLWRISGKKVGLWYAHGHAPFSLRIAEKLSHIIFTSTKSGCRLKSKKIKVVGQGIDIERFSNVNFQMRSDGIFRIITIGRISPVKDYGTLIRAVEILKSGGVHLEVDIIGGAGLPEQEKYLADLQKTAEDKGLNNIINFAAAVPNKDIAYLLRSADLFVSMSRTGSLDKAILEAMVLGLPVLTCNEALLEVLGDYKSKLMYGKGNYKELAKKIKFIAGMSAEEREKIARDLREIVVKNHGTERLVKNILENLRKNEN